MAIRFKVVPTVITAVAAAAVLGAVGIATNIIPLRRQKNDLM